jgi:TRAP transporter TAXI family solute receptor
VKALPFADASAQLLAGTVDAMFDNAMHPTASAALALGAGAHLVPIDGSHVRRLTREYPFLKMTVLPRDTYPGTETIPTVGVNSLLVCSRLLGEEIVHELTARLFQALPLLSTSRRLGLAELDEASTTPIPLHDGAARYYREQELLR